MTKLKILVLLLIGLLIGAGIAWAVKTYVLSNHITGIAENYDLTLTVNSTSPWMVGETLNFTGTLTSTTYIFTHINVSLYMNDTYTGFSDLTNSNGFYTILYTISLATDYDFYANATIT